MLDKTRITRRMRNPQDAGALREIIANMAALGMLDDAAPETSALAEFTAALHYGPGPHPDGSPQAVHGGGANPAVKARSTEGQMTLFEDSPQQIQARTPPRRPSPRPDKPAQPARAAPTLDAATENEAHLNAIYGDRLHVEDRVAPLTQKYLGDLAALPDEFHKQIASLPENKFRGIWLGNRPITDQDDKRYLKGKTPRGWPRGSTWDTVSGVGGTDVVLGTGRDGSAAVAIHELTHTWYSGRMTKALKAELGEHHARLLKRGDMHPYYQQPGEYGPSELFAEATAQVAKNRAQAVAEFDSAFVAWIERTTGVRGRSR